MQVTLTPEEIRYLQFVIDGDMGVISQTIESDLYAPHIRQRVTARAILRKLEGEI